MSAEFRYLWKVFHHVSGDALRLGAGIFRWWCRQRRLCGAFVVASSKAAAAVVAADGVVTAVVALWLGISMMLMLLEMMLLPMLIVARIVLLQLYVFERKTRHFGVSVELCATADLQSTTRRSRRMSGRWTWHDEWRCGH